MKKHLTLLAVVALMATTANTAQAGCTNCDQGYLNQATACTNCDQGYPTRSYLVGAALGALLLGAAAFYYHKNRQSA
jgi:hypothetical protein